MDKNCLLEVENLSVQVGDHQLVRSVGFTLRKSETLCLVGESGSGKTTTSLAIMGLLSKKRGFNVSGRVLFEGKNLVDMPDTAWRDIRGVHLGMIFQDPASSLNPVFPIGDQISEMFEIHAQLDIDAAEEKTIEALKSVGLGQIADPFETYPHQLSGGMKQRVMIAMALSLGPQILIADEPTSALDLTVQKEILLLLKEFKGATLLITHDLGVVAEMADVVAVMFHGQIVEYASVYDIFTKPTHPYTKALLDARPQKANRRRLLPTTA